MTTNEFRFSRSPMFLLLALFLCFSLTPSALADESNIAESAPELPLERIESEDAVIEHSDDVPNRLDALNRRSSGEPLSEPEQEVFRSILWYIPNRLIDLFDIFRLDVGLGGSGGAVLRVTRYGQLGGRYVNPLSARIGLRGRQAPFFLEKYSEYGFGPNFQQTPNRHVTPYELGIGVDAVVGGYVGFSFDELFDFLAGFLLFDPKQDDLVS